MLSPLELRQVRLEKLEIRVSSTWGLKPLADEMCRYNCYVEPAVRKRRGHWDFRVSLDVAFMPLEGETCRFDLIGVRLVGLFHLPDDTEESLVKTLVPLNCLAILYGIARGAVAQATGMVPGGPMILPPVNFVEVLKQRKRRKPKAITTNEPQ